MQPVKVNVQYVVVKSDKDLTKLMTRKINLAVYTEVIVGHYNAVLTNNFERICMEISTVQRLTGISNSKSKKNHSCGNRRSERR